MKSKWENICDNLLLAFKDTNAPYIKRICELSRSGIIPNKVSWWTEGIFEILEELINGGYFPKDGNEEYLFQAVALLEEAQRCKLMKL